MFENKKKEWNEYLNKEIQNTKKEEQELLLEDRKDESDHRKVKTNIYEVFQTVFSALEKNMPPEALVTSYLKKMESIPAGWRQSLEKAKTHDDVEKILIEEIKLDTINEMQQKFKEIWGDAE